MPALRHRYLKAPLFLNHTAFSSVTRTTAETRLQILHLSISTEKNKIKNLFSKTVSHTRTGL